MPANSVILSNQHEISETIDYAAYYLDNKDINKVMEHFSADAQLEVIEGDTTICDLKGSAAIKAAYASHISGADLVFHLTGTKIIQVQVMDQAASANTCCIARIIGHEPNTTTTQFLEYNDRLIKVDGWWYIVERTVHILSSTIR